MSLVITLESHSIYIIYTHTNSMEYTNAATNAPCQHLGIRARVPWTFYLKFGRAWLPRTFYLTLTWTRIISLIRVEGLHTLTGPILYTHKLNGIYKMQQLMLYVNIMGLRIRGVFKVQTLWCPRFNTILV